MRPEPSFFWFSSEKTLLIVFHSMDHADPGAATWSHDDLAHVVLVAENDTATIAFEAIGELGVLLVPLSPKDLAVPFEIQLTIYPAEGDQLSITRGFDDLSSARALNESPRTAEIRVALVASTSNGGGQRIYSLGDFQNDGRAPLADLINDAVALEASRVASESAEIHAAVLSPRSANGHWGPAELLPPPGPEVTVEVMTSSRPLESAFAFLTGRFFKDLAFSLSLRVLTPNAFFRFASTRLMRFTPGTHGQVALSVAGQAADRAESERERAIGAAAPNDVVMVGREYQRHGAASRDTPAVPDTITWKGPIYTNDHFYFEGLPPGTRFIDQSGLIERRESGSLIGGAPMLLVFTDHRKWIGFSLGGNPFETTTKLSKLQKAVFDRAKAAYSFGESDLPEMPEDMNRLAPFDRVLPRDRPGVAGRHRLLHRLARWIAARRVAGGRRSLEPAKLQLRLSTFGEALAPHRSIGGAAVRVDRFVSSGAVPTTVPDIRGRWNIIREIAFLAARDNVDAGWLQTTSDDHASGLAAIIWQSTPDVASVLVDGVMRHRILLDGPRNDFSRLSGLIDFLDGIAFDPMGMPAEIFKARLKSYLRSFINRDEQTIANLERRMDVLDQPLDARALPTPLPIAVAFESYGVLANRLTQWRDIAKTLRDRLDAHPSLRPLAVPFDAVSSHQAQPVQPGARFGPGNRIELLGRLADQETGDVRYALLWLRDQLLEFDQVAYNAMARLDAVGLGVTRVVAATQPAGETVGRYAARMQLNWILDDTFPAELEMYARRADDIFSILADAAHGAKSARMNGMADAVGAWWREGALSAMSFSTVRFASNEDIAGRIGRALALSALHAALLRRTENLYVRLQAGLDEIERVDGQNSPEYANTLKVSERILDMKNALKQIAGVPKFDFVKLWIDFERLAQQSKVYSDIF